jgi:hypothetical protein
LAATVNDAGLRDGLRPDLPDRLGQALQPVADDHERVVQAAVAQLGEHVRPELGTLAAVPDPQAQDVAAALGRDTDNNIDGTVGDFPIPDLDVDRVDEQDGVNRVERPVLPLGHRLDHAVGDCGDGRFGHLHPIDLLQVSGDFAVSEAPGRQGQHHLIDPAHPPLPFAHDLRVEGGVPVAWHVDLDRADVGDDGLGAGAVAVIDDLTLSRLLTPRPTQMSVHLALQRGLQDELQQPAHQTVPADQLAAVRLRLSHQPADQRLLLQQHLLLILPQTRQISLRVLEGFLHTHGVSSDSLSHTSR